MFKSIITLNNSKFNKNLFENYFYFKSKVDNFSENENLNIIEKLRKGLVNYDTFIVIDGDIGDGFKVNENKTNNFNEFINSFVWSNNAEIEFCTNMKFDPIKPVLKSNIFVFKFETFDNLLDFQKYAIPSNISAYICTTLKEKKCCCK